MMSYTIKLVTNFIAYKQRHLVLASLLTLQIIIIIGMKTSTLTAFSLVLI
jgi:hypothetical protein